ncbi:MAG: serine/threonine-protein phosphatase [Actinomyces sp.]|nr:serine/threonine-protein phosphatase [Actinomyces sp.]
MDSAIAEAVGPGGARLVIAHAARTDVGRRRVRNEDSWGAAFPAYFVADGMGGNDAGDIASRAVVDAVCGSLELGAFATPALLSEAVSRAAASVCALGAGHRAPGSTLTGVAFQEYRGKPCAAVFNIGDSRTYLLSEGSFEQISVDHSEVQELLDAGCVTDVEARALPRRNVITRALGAGMSGDVAADIFMVPVHCGDRWVICSDGLSGEVTDALIEMIVRHVTDREQATDELIAQALGAGGKDNVTVIIVDVVEAAPEWGQPSSGDETVDNDATLSGPTHAGLTAVSAQEGPHVSGVEEYHA